MLLAEKTLLLSISPVTGVNSTKAMSQSMLRELLFLCVIVLTWGLEGVVPRSSLHDRFPGFLPSHYATVEVVDRAAFCRELFGGHKAAFTAAAVDGHFAFDILDALGKISGFNVDVFCTCKVPFGIFLRGPHIDKLYILFANNLGEFLYTYGRY